jgi:hypothetical protein
MKIEVIKAPRGRAIKAGEICPVDPKKKHWMCRIVGLDDKFGFNRDFLRRALYDSKGKSAGYSIDGLKEGDIVEEADAAKNKEYARIVKIDDSGLEFEYMRASEVSASFKPARDRTRAAA